MIDDITIDLQFFGNFANIEDIRRKCNPNVDFSKFISNKKILIEVIALSYNKILDLKKEEEVINIIVGLCRWSTKVINTI